MGPQWGAFCQITLTTCFTKLQTDISKAQYVFNERVFVSMYGGLINNGQELGVRSLPVSVSVTAVSEQMSFGVVSVLAETDEFRFRPKLISFGFGRNWLLGYGRKWKIDFLSVSN